MNSGTIKFFDANRGFGFIIPETGKELFFHISQIMGQEPREGDKVNFEHGEGPRGPCATEVKVSL